MLLLFPMSPASAFRRLRKKKNNNYNMQERRRSSGSNGFAALFAGASSLLLLGFVLLAVDGGWAANAAAQQGSAGGTAEEVVVQATGETTIAAAADDAASTTTSAGVHNTTTTCAALGSDAPCRAAGDDTVEPPDFRCGLYMAVSTIPGAGLGIFSGVDRRPGGYVGEGDPLIPLVDLYYHLQNSPEFDPEDMEHQSESLDPTSDYVWHGSELGMQQESAYSDTQCTAYCPGLDAAINCNLALINVDKLVPEYDDGGLRRNIDPGAGAFTPYHNCTTVVTAPIPAGGELFKVRGGGATHWYRRLLLLTLMNLQILTALFPSPRHSSMGTTGF